MTILNETDVPNDIAHCARRLNAYMEEHHHRDWQLMGVCDRAYSAKLVNLLETFTQVFRQLGWTVNTTDTLDRMDRTEAGPTTLGQLRQAHGILRGPDPDEDVRQINPAWVNATHEMRWIDQPRAIHMGPPPEEPLPMEAFQERVRQLAGLAPQFDARDIGAGMERVRDGTNTIGPMNDGGEAMTERPF